MTEIPKSIMELRELGALLENWGLGIEWTPEQEKRLLREAIADLRLAFLAALDRLGELERGNGNRA